jgi:hypothetical protein
VLAAGVALALKYPGFLYLELGLRQHSRIQQAFELRQLLGLGSGRC